jgi:CBS domain-containing protein
MWVRGWLPARVFGPDLVARRPLVTDGHTVQSEYMTDATNPGESPVSILFEESVARVAPDTSLRDVARALTEGDIGLLVVGAGEEVAGVISERDLVRAVAGGRDVESTRAIDAATTSVVWCDVTATIAEVAAEMMEHYVRHILVEDGGRLAGVVSARDVLGAYVSSDVDFET